MTDVPAVRDIALLLPGVEERAHSGRPSFRVRGKIFATLREDEGSAVVRLTEEYRAALVGSEPETFTPVVWGNLKGQTKVRLAGADPEEMRELLVEAWRTVAPKRLVAAYDAAERPPA